MTALTFLRRLRSLSGRTTQSDITAYLRGGRKPWSRGYVAFKDRFIAQAIADGELLDELRQTGKLPEGYAPFLDERAVEYPWTLSRLSSASERMLDAGSTFNYAHLLDHPFLKSKELTIATLSPETHAFWQRGISYVYADLRILPFRDDWFDTVASISTIEHIGMDNTLYVKDGRYKEAQEDGFVSAVRELRRVCRPGGRILISVPYGKPTRYGWYQQFDAFRLGRLVEEYKGDAVQTSIYQYRDGAWQISDADSSKDCEGFDIHQTKYFNRNSTRDYDPDFAAASRAIAAIEIVKGTRR